MPASQLGWDNEMAQFQLLIAEVLLGILFLGVSGLGWIIKREATKQSEHRKEIYHRLNDIDKMLARNCVYTQESNKKIEKIENRLNDQMLRSKAT